MLIVSACLLGIRSRYDGKSKPNRDIIDLARHKVLIPVCPEQLGGLPTPRLSSEIEAHCTGFDVLSGKGRVLAGNGAIDVSEAFIKGAQQILIIAKLVRAERCILKSKSPSCGVSNIVGVTAAALILADYDVVEV